MEAVPWQGVVPQVDVWLRALDRRTVDPVLVSRLEQRIRAREVLMASWVRCELLARTKDGRQFLRVQAALDGYPEVRLTLGDQIEAARLVHQARTDGRVPPNLVQALAWSAAIRIGVRLWTQDRRWLSHAEHGCPIAADGIPT